MNAMSQLPSGAAVLLVGLLAAAAASTVVYAEVFVPIGGTSSNSGRLHWRHLRAAQGHAAEAKLADAARGLAAKAFSIRPAAAAKLPASAAVPSSGLPGAQMAASPPAAALRYNPAGLPVVPALKARAPAVPRAAARDHPVQAVLQIETSTATMPVSPLHKYTWWTFDGTVPGPVVRRRLGDTLEVRHTNRDATGLGHNIDFHAVTGPAATYAEPGETKTAFFKLVNPGLFIYHCAAPHLPAHVANGMYGLILVEPETGLPPVDKEFSVIQCEVYAKEGTVPGQLEHAYSDGMDENFSPMYVVYNGAVGALTEKPLIVDQDDRVRIYYGNAGPNKIATFHIIGMVFDKVFRDGDLISPPGRSIQTVVVPPGGAVVVEFTALVPGDYKMLDHAIFRVDKGCVGILKVRPKGTDSRLDLFDPVE
ncbi:hypothetical protein OEZ86_012204 [Tetradesmus obliquus]|nr:hypothetical protein OEZ86_012204 [Tetradesmus obliquus]